ncbi:MAG TPA: hypothetical protein VHE55_05060 [Fimbriimonadaceae bacterium]|nr:hypothetical protein [Fimbriimonadaceae bacterium]
MSPLLLAICMAAPQDQGPSYIRLKGPSGDFAIENLSSFSAENPFGPGKVTLAGNPVRIFWRDAGMALTANSVVGETALDSATRNYYLKSADISGNATTTFDSDESERYRIKKAKDAGLPALPPSEAKGRLTLMSDAYRYVGNYDIGTFTLAHAFVGTWTATGSFEATDNDKPAMLNFDDTADVHGGNGSIETFTHLMPGTSPLRKGFVTGSPTFTYTRKWSLGGKPMPDKTVYGKADRIDIDFLSAKHTITLTGHVELSGQSDGYSGSAIGTLAVITFGPNDEVDEIHMEGTPTVTNIKPIKSGGSKL